MNQGFFVNMVDELVEDSEHNPELKSALNWLDEQAYKKGISLYDMMFEVLWKHDMNIKAKEWLKNKNG